MWELRLILCGMTISESRTIRIPCKLLTYGSGLVKEAVRYMQQCGPSAYVDAQQEQ